MSLKKESQISLMVIGTIGLFSGLFLYNKFNAFETQGEELDISLPFFLTLIYDFFGKSAASGIISLTGLIMIVSGILSINNQKKWKALQIENSKPKFISLSEDLEFQITRKLSNDLVDYFERLNFEIKEGQIYKHYWTDSLVFEKENDENFLNMAVYFWKSDLPFSETLLPETFENFQKLEFRFLTSSDTIKSEKIKNDVDKYYYEEGNKKKTISSLAEANSIEYCQIQTLDHEDSDDLRHYEDELYFVLTNPILKCRNNELYIGENAVSIEIAYAIGAIDLVRKKRNT
ncbi:hypothetical protein ACFFLS_22095 [Flavobacterium procerum]|uniref:Uncharacterized protein n=1 Tax=Flavobacterium procerum TaxID=1455569 RepID=A0ABV6BWG1_9FLAO